MGVLSLLCGFLSMFFAIGGGLWLSTNPSPDQKEDARLCLYAAMFLGVAGIVTAVLSWV